MSQNVSPRTLSIKHCAIPEVLLLRPTRHGDDRGFLVEIYHCRSYVGSGIDVEFVQDNFTLSRHRGVVRGLHFQIPPFAQHKLVWVAKGSIFDVAVDIRHGSPTFGKHVGIVLDAESLSQIFIPAGFAHGFCSLEPDTCIVYKVSKHYSAAHERGLAWNDPMLGIPWPIANEAAILSARDRLQPSLAKLSRYFEAAASGSSASK